MQTPVTPIGVPDYEVETLTSIPVGVARAFDESPRKLNNAWANEFRCLAVRRDIMTPWEVAHVAKLCSVGACGRAIRSSAGQSVELVLAPVLDGLCSQSEKIVWVKKDVLAWAIHESKGSSVRRQSASANATPGVGR